MRAIFPTYSLALQIKTNKFLVRPSELSYAKNVVPSMLGSWKLRPGYTKLGNTVSSGNNITGLYGFEQSDGTNELLVTASTSLKYSTGGNWSAIAGISPTATTLVNFATFLDKAYIVGANSANSYLTSGTLDGTTYSEDSNIPKARYVIEYFDKIYLFDCEVGGVRYPSRAYYSSIPTSGAITFTTATDFLECQTDNSDFGQGVAKSFGRLLLFKKNSLFTWDLSNLTEVDAVGTTSSRSIQNIGNNVLYFHYSAKKKGIMMWNGAGSQKISKAIDPIIEGMTSALTTTCPAGVKDDHYYLYVGDVTLNADIAEYYGLDDVTLSNILIDYSFTDNSWVLHSLPVDVKVMSSYNNKLYFGDNDGMVHEWLSGTTDNSTVIEAEIRTHNFYGRGRTEFNKRKTFNSIIINMHKPNSARAFYEVDNGDPVELGMLDKKVNYFSISDKGYGIKVKVVSVSDEFIFEGTEIEYTLEEALK